VPDARTANYIPAATRVVLYGDVRTPAPCDKAVVKPPAQDLATAGDHRDGFGPVGEGDWAEILVLVGTRRITAVLLLSAEAREEDVSGPAIDGPIGFETTEPRPPDRYRSGPDLFGRLTVREREVTALVALGLTNHDIAEELVVSAATVKTHVTRSMAKLDAHHRAKLVALAYQTGFVRPQCDRDKRPAIAWASGDGDGPGHGRAGKGSGFQPGPHRAGLGILQQLGYGGEPCRFKPPTDSSGVPPA
jgi:DNA-binding CsgD family transcriptional regulator